jgi:hypothetical protein
MTVRVGGDDCLACKEGWVGHPVGDVWRAPTDYHDLVAAVAAGVPVHDWDGDCVASIVRPGWKRVEGDNLAAVYTTRRFTREFVRSVDTFCIYADCEPPAEHELDAAIQTIVQSFKHQGEPT